MNSSKRNVYLVDLGSGSDLNLLPLGFTLVGSYSAADPVLSAAYHFDYRFLRPPLETLVDDMPDPAVVALACYNWNIRGSLEVARRVKLRHPGAITVLGGCSVPNDHERIGVFLHQHPYVDILVRGEGEQIFSELLHQLLPGGDLHLLNGISFRDHEAPDAFVTTGAPGIIHDLTALPSPFLNGVMDRLLLRYRDQITGVLWETTRGCPYSCSFCYWGDSAMNKLRRHDLDRLRAEIEWIGRNQFSYIFATDPNFGILSKRDEAVAAMVVETKQKYGFPKQFGVNWSKNAGERILRVADILSEGGIGTTINTAVQSFHEPTLSAVKRLNISRDDMQMVKEALFAKGGSTMTEIILGLPMDTYESFVATINQAMSSQIGDNFIIYLCQLIDNTELASDSSREQYKIDGRLCRGSAQNRVYHDKSDDVEELIEVIVETSTMPIPDWRRAYVAGYCGTSIYRVGFFPINFLRYFHNVEPMDFIEFTIAELERDPVDFPTLSKGLQHVVTQQQMILDGIAEKMGIEGLEDVAINPDVAACAIFLYDSRRFFTELRDMSGRLLAARGISLDWEVFEDVFVFQEASVPIWPWEAAKTRDFLTNIPEVMEAMGKGRPLPVIEKRATRARFLAPIDQQPQTILDYLRTCVRNTGVTFFSCEIVIPHQKIVLPASNSLPISTMPTSGFMDEGKGSP